MAERLFVGWHRPFLELAIPSWIELVRARELDPARCVIVLPGRRAARRVEERIAELAPCEWAPPTVVTEGALASVLAHIRPRLASAWERALAWRAALRACKPEDVAALWSEASALPERTLARSCARAFEQLAAEGLEVSEVASLALERAEIGRASRWRALAAVEQRYRAELARRGGIDPAIAALEIAKRGVRGDLHVQLFALVDPTRSLRNLLGSVDLTAFVFAPAELADAFDELGALRARAWSERDLATRIERWRAVDGPDDQARAAVAHLGSVAARSAPEEVSVGVADSDVLPFVERRLLEAGCEPRWAGGTPLACSRPALLVSSTFGWLAEHAFEDYATLVRHPDLDPLLGGAESFLAALDEYASDHVPASIDGQWLAIDSRRSRTRVAVLERGHAALIELLGDLADARARSCAEWADGVARLAARIWPQIDRAARAPEEWRHARALEALAEILDEARLAPAAPVTAREMLELLAERFEAAMLPPPPSEHGRPVIELLGWLELALDDAPQLVVCGMNEGSVPEPGGGDSWLYEPARRALGLAHEERRVARDAWALAAILASRPDTLLVSGRRNARRDPKVPSRFLFRCEEAEIVERVRRAWPQRETDAPARVGAPTAYRGPLVEAALPESLPVTAFRDYLSSPYVFYVRHVLRLDTRDDRALELDPRAFGILAHDVLQTLSERGLGACADVERLRAEFEGALERLVAQRFADNQRPAVRLQIERLRHRLRSFASWQAKQASEGWELAHAEWEAPPRELEGVAILGRIDRIDRHRVSGAWRLIDYKTGDSGASAVKAHGKPGAWKDLQLPLYRWLSDGLRGGGSVELGFVTLGRKNDEERFQTLSLDDAGYADALATARDVIERMQRREFAQVGRKAPQDPLLAALCGFGLVADDEDPEEDE